MLGLHLPGRHLIPEADIHAIHGDILGPFHSHGGIFHFIAQVNGMPVPVADAIQGFIFAGRKGNFALGSQIRRFPGFLGQGGQGQQHQANQRCQ